MRNKSGIWLLLCAVAWQGCAIAADEVPAHLTGTWGTAESLYEGETSQAHLHIEADGLGLMIGSTPPARRIDGMDDGTPSLRAIVGFPVRVSVDGAVLTARPVALDPKDKAQAERYVFTCRVDAAAEAMTCSGPPSPAIRMTRRRDAPAEEIVTELARIRRHLKQAG